MNYRIYFISFLFFQFYWGNTNVYAQLTASELYIKADQQFIAYEQIPSWTGVIVDWKMAPKVHLYDIEKYKGHSNFVSKGLRRGISFSQFKEEVRYPEKRKYIPFFLFDLRQNPIRIGETEYYWAVRFEDYRYEDDPKGLEQTFLSAISLIKEQTAAKGKGIMILSKSPAAQPNYSIKKVVRANGYLTMSLNELLENYSNKQNKSTAKKQHSKNLVLNEGDAIGYLKYIPRGKEAEVSGNYKDILVYENLPERVPLAAGILTFEIQTPLSHINLLAKNRGTPNAVVLNPEDKQKIKALNRAICRIELTENNKIKIEKVKLEEAQAFWKTRKKMKIDIPEMDLSVRSISYFDIGSKSVQNVNCIGAKAANYALLQDELPKSVRKGFGIPFYFYDKMLKTSGTDKLIEKLIRDEAKISIWARNQQLKAIREKIRSAQVDEQLLRELKQIAKQYFPGKRIRLRSSTNCEDLPTFNGAGLYKSKGFWETDDPAEIEKKILKVYASLWTSKAFEERAFFSIDHQKAGMAILINEAFREEYANGVVLTIPEKVGGLRIHINSQYGENSVTNATVGEQAEAIFFRQKNSKWYVVESKSSIHDVFINQSDLTPLVRALQTISIQLDALLKKEIESEKQINYGVDLEFKIMKEKMGFKLYIKQARLLYLGM